MNNKTINYYNQHVKSFIQTTKSVDFTNIQNKFLSYLPPEASRYTGIKVKQILFEEFDANGFIFKFIKE